VYPPERNIDSNERLTGWILKALEGKDVKDMLLNVGSGAGAAAAPSGAAATAAGGGTAPEEKKEEKEEGMFEPLCCRCYVVRQWVYNFSNF
jgi:ribosomal protein L12E/L44/L45/RPP1/RPP2